MQIYIYIYAHIYIYICICTYIYIYITFLLCLHRTVLSTTSFLTVNKGLSTKTFKKVLSTSSLQSFHLTVLSNCPFNDLRRGDGQLSDGQFAEVWLLRRKRVASRPCFQKRTHLHKVLLYHLYDSGFL